MELWLQLVLVFVINFAAAFIQGATGFGYALVAMALMPLFLPMAQCSAISAVTIVAIAIQMTVTLRKNIRLKVIALPVLCCFLTINLGLYILDSFDEFTLRIILACLLFLVTGLFFFMRKRNISLPDRWYSGAGAGFITGLSTGMFNIVGPFLMIYYMNVCQSTLLLKASLESSFLLAGLYSASMHAFLYKNITAELIPALAVSVAGALIAGVWGLKVYKKINKDKIALAIYILLPLMGVNLIINGLTS